MSNHHIEQKAVVWLALADEGWEVDSPSDDGYPLEGYENGALHEECDECEDWDEGDAAAKGAPDVPTLPELTVILNAYQHGPAVRRWLEDYEALDTFRQEVSDAFEQAEEDWNYAKADEMSADLKEEQAAFAESAADLLRAILGVTP